MDHADRLLAEMYKGLRAGQDVRAPAVEYACLVLDFLPLPAVRELVALAPHELTDARAAELARALLAHFEPDFVLAPERWDTLVAMLRIAVRDLRRSGPDPEAEVELVRPEWARDFDLAYVFYNGQTHGGGIPSGAGTDRESALAAVAEALQEQVMEFTWSVWPLCPTHHVGLHVEDRPVWHCRTGEHDVAAVGEL